MMKTKPILISAGVIIALAIGIFLFVRGKDLLKPKKAEISQFLYGFSNRVNEGNTDSLMAYFEANGNAKTLVKLVKLLAGKKSFNANEKPLANIKLDVDACDIKIINSELAIAT